jgi:hypothetical protein
MPLTTTEPFDSAALTALIAAATVLGSDVKAGLYINNVQPSKVLTIGDLTEPPYASYVRQAVVLGPAFRDPVNGIASVAGALTWQMTGSPTPCIIVGIFYTYGAGPALLGIEPFKTPIPLNDDLDAFVSVLEYIQSNENPGFSTIIR